MHTHTPSLFRLTLLSYLILCLATTAPATADAAARAAVCLSSAALYLLGAAASTACPRAFASNEPEKSKSPTLISSKPAIWVNYADPRPKGDDADKGTQPSYYPEVSVNNVSLMPAVSHRLFSVNFPLGPADISPVLSYSPPVVSISKSLNDPSETITYAADPGPFGNCWSDNLTPCVERSANRKTVIFSTFYERTLSVNGGPTPSASFKTSSIPVYNSNDTFDTFAVTWDPQPLTKATVLNTNHTIQFWGSGLTIDESGASTTEWVSCRLGTLNNFTRRSWPSRVLDRNGNALLFSYWMV